MTCKNWLCTFNMEDKDMVNWEAILKEFYEKTGARYCCGQLEKGEETGHAHIQFFLNFKKSVRIGTITKVNKRVHCEKVKVDNGAAGYCMKEDTRIEGPLEFGTKPFKANNKTDWDSIKALAKAGDLEKIPASVYVLHYNKLKSIAKDHMVFKDADHLRGIWIYGEAGAGKSRWIRDEAKRLGLSLYPKLCNKWWDGYKGEKVVVMDDLMPVHVVLGQHLKIWSDRYDCILETKGGACHAEYDWFVVTSQYRISEVFTDEKDVEAIKRRFQEFSISAISGLSLCLSARYNTQASGETA